MDDLFYKEQEIYNNAVCRANALKTGAHLDEDEYNSLAREYGKLLRQLRLVTKIYDRTNDDLKISKQDLLDKVHFDTLTGIYNRLFMEESMAGIIKSLSRTGGLLSVLMIDVDFFKEYNDTYGHTSGDKCLKALANAFSKSVSRESDFAARFGGEEFVVILPNTDESGARMVADRIIKNVDDLHIPHEESDVSGYVTVSIGATTAKVDFVQSGESYIKRADEALYISKQNGRNKYTFIDFRGDSI